ncbi:MAG: hypothetical protein DMF60_18995 [Acidobacteria bacterium]|nr:MAG: hypothetical protein DMF60_18995 [Acidobacteriota bacterium]
METLESLIRRRDALDSVIARIDVWLLFFGILVVIGVAGESIFGFWSWRKNRNLHEVQLAIDQFRQAEIARLQNDNLKLQRVIQPRRIVMGDRKLAEASWIISPSARRAMLRSPLSGVWNR